MTPLVGEDQTDNGSTDDVIDPAKFSKDLVTFTLHKSSKFVFTGDPKLIFKNLVTLKKFYDPIIVKISS